MFKNKMTKTFMVTGLAGALLFTSACSAVETQGGSSSASPEVVVVDGVEYGPTIEGMPTLKELASDSKGEWRKTTILPDDPAFNFSDSIVDPTATAMWSADEIKEGQRFAVEVLVDSIDTSANGSPGDSASIVDWWEVNKDKFHPAWKQEMYNAAIDTDPNKAIIFKGTHRVDTTEYEMPYGEDAIHIKDRTIETTMIRAGEIEQGKALEVSFDVAFKTPLEKGGQKADESVEGTAVYTLLKDEDTGKFLFAGFNVEYKYETPK